MFASFSAPSYSFSKYFATNEDLSLKSTFKRRLAFPVEKASVVGGSGIICACNTPIFQLFFSKNAKLTSWKSGAHSG